MPEGYQTKIGVRGCNLSGGQRQRLALARAVYNMPNLLVLDEPNSNMDQEGETALNKTIAHFRETGRTVIIIAHRWGALEHCNKILVLEAGKQKAFGLKEEIIKTGPSPKVTPLHGARQ